MPVCSMSGLEMTIWPARADDLADVGGRIAVVGVGLDVALQRGDQAMQPGQLVLR